MAASKWAFVFLALEPGGSVDAHLHSFEETFYVIEGDLMVDLAGGTVQATTGDYGLFPVATPHALRNDSAEPVRVRRDEGAAAQSAIRP